MATAGIEPETFGMEGIPKKCEQTNRERYILIFGIKI